MNLKFIQIRARESRQANTTIMPLLALAAAVPAAAAPAAAAAALAAAAPLALAATATALAAIAAREVISRGRAFMDNRRNRQPAADPPAEPAAPDAPDAEPAAPVGCDHVRADGLFVQGPCKGCRALARLAAYGLAAPRAAAASEST